VLRQRRDIETSVIIY